MIGTIQQYLDDAKASLALAIVATKGLLPTSVKKDEQLAHAHMQGPVWNILAERTDLTHLTDEGLIVKSLLEALTGMVDAMTQTEGARLQMEAACRIPNLTLVKKR